MKNLTLFIFLTTGYILSSSNGKLSFWQSGIVYQIYPRSLMDSNGDGVGDLQGIISKVSYFKDIGVSTIWLSPIFTSPMADFGYDITNFTDIDPIFGDMSDFDELVKVFHDRGIKIVLDFVPNHSSNESKWFIKSEQNDSRYKDYYIWADPKGFDTNGDPIPPNNWLGVFRFSAWQWSEKRRQYYYHAFLKEQPDLNYRNPAVVREMQNVLRFWLERGVDGFRMDAVRFIFEVEDIYNSYEPAARGEKGGDDPSLYKYLNHIYTVDLNQTFTIIRGWRDVLNEYAGDKLIMVEDFSSKIEQTMKYYGTNQDPLADFPFNLYLLRGLGTRSDVTGCHLKELVDLWLENIPEGKWPNWVLGNHDFGRIGSRVGQSLVDSLNMFNLLLPGTPITYYGEEIGMENTAISFEEGVDPSGCNLDPQEFATGTRDPQRTPMQWDRFGNAGFSTGNSTWLPVNENYVSKNVADQNAATQSPLLVYKALARLRKSRDFQQGALHFPIVTESIFSFVRVADSCAGYLVAINCGKTEHTTNFLRGDANYSLPSTGIIAIRSSSDSRNETLQGTLINLSSVSLIGGEGLVIKLTI